MVYERLLSERSYDNRSLIPIKSSFRDLQTHLEKLNVQDSSLSGILIDTGINSMQWANQNRGFCHLRDGILDLRMDPSNNTPRGYEVLQNIDETSLLRLLKRYGAIKNYAKHIANAILEARYMHYEFKTVHELGEVMEIAVKNANLEDPGMIVTFLSKTILALRMFVNDELNQLDFAIRYLAVKYLKENGILAVIAHNDAEAKLIYQCLKSIDVDKDKKSLSVEVIVYFLSDFKFVS